MLTKLRVTADGAGRQALARDAPAAVLAALVALYAATFGWLTWAQHANFRTFGFDMGIYDQGIWLLSRFREPFVTVRGLNYFAHHVNLVTVLLVPAYWLGGGPILLYLVQTVWMALGAVPVWLLARDRLRSRWAAVALAAAFLLYPSLEWINWWHFHPDALTITPLLFAWWLATQKRWRPFAVAVAVTLSCKEDAALAVAMLGLALAWRGHRRAGLLTAAAGAAWFVLCTAVIIPAANGGRPPFYGELFPGFGSSLREVALNVLTNPAAVAEVATRPERLGYYQDVLAPVALLPLAAPSAAAIGAPQLLVNVLSGHRYTYDFRYHYTSIIIAAAFIATVEAIARAAGRPRLRNLLTATVLAAALVTNALWSPSPLGTALGARDQQHAWATAPPPNATAIHEALALIPPDAAVSATYYLVPHLTQRVRIYEFPNPWVPVAWGAHGENQHDPAAVDYLVLDVGVTEGGEHAALYRQLIATEFEPVYQRDGITVARRQAGGSR